MELASVGKHRAFGTKLGCLCLDPFRLTNGREKRKNSGENLGRIVKRYAIEATLLLTVAFVFLVTPTSSTAQGTGEFLCSAGTRDGLTCEQFTDCPGGVCVIAQGVCSGGQICVCPGGGVCVSTPSCALDPFFGTCQGGVAEGVCCDADFNCGAGDTCVATHRLCLSGDRQGFPCRNNTHCNGAVCGSTGAFCDGGSADSFSCVDSSDCPGGLCDTSFVNVPTSTPVTPGPTNPVATATPVTPGSTPLPTNTRLPIPTIGVDPTPTSQATSPPQNSPTPVPPTATFTPVVGELVTTIGEAAPGANKITVNIDPDDFPVDGVVDVGGGALIDFTRHRSSNILNLKAPAGLPFGIGAGSVVRVVEYTPTPGPVFGEDRRIDKGNSCAIQPSGDRRGYGALWALGLGVALLAVRRRRRV